MVDVAGSYSEARHALRSLCPQPLLNWREARFYGRYGEVELHLLEFLCRRDADAIDVGANDGSYAHYMRRYARHVFAYEPMPSLAQALREKFQRRVTVEAMALSDSSGTVELRSPVVDGVVLTGCSTISDEAAAAYPGHRGVEVPMDLLDHVYRGNAGFIKIDVEGHEQSVLDGAIETIRRCRPRMLVEIDDRLSPGGLERARKALAPSFHPFRDQPATIEMQRYRQNFPPLPLVDRYMGDIGQAMAATINSHPASALHLQTTVQSVHLRDDGTVAVFARGHDAQPRTLVARSAIVALGGRQPWQEKAPESGLRFPDSAKRRVLSSNVLLSHDGLAIANDIIAAAGSHRIIILGGSHSAYAVAWALLHLSAARTLGEGQIAIVQRRPPRIFYPDRAAAVADLYHVAPGDICARTHRVNRMGGLRGHGRDMWRQVACRPGTTPEPRGDRARRAGLRPGRAAGNARRGGAGGALPWLPVGDLAGVRCRWPAPGLERRQQRRCGRRRLPGDARRWDQAAQRVRHRPRYRVPPLSGDGLRA
jgi:FkbM family methyltransferase